MANLFDVYNDGSIIDHTEGEKLETGETPITISGLTAYTTYDKVQVAFAGSYNKADVPSFKTNPGRNLILGTSDQVVQATNWNMKVADINYDKILGRTLCASVLISNADYASNLVKGSSYILLEAIDKSGNLLKSISGNSVLYNANGISQCSISMDDNTASVRVRIRTNNMNQNTYYSRLKVERGNVPTPWIPAPEDDVT